MRHGTLLLLLTGVLALNVQAEERGVVMVTGSSPVTARVGQVIRVSDRINAGGTITATVEGVGKLVGTNTVNKIKEGRFWVDATGKEFEVLAQEPGTITITLTLDSKQPDTKPQTKVYTVRVRAFPFRAPERSVVVVTDEKPARARVGDVIRVTAARQAGPGTTTAEVEGPGKLVNTNSLTEVGDRGPLAGAHVTEFEVRATAKGAITITCAMFNERLNRREVKIYTIEVE